MSGLSDIVLRQLAAESAIRRTLARYCHTVDDGDFAAFGECFTPDAEIEAFGRTRNGREAVTAFMAKAMPPENRGKHVTGNTVIEDITADGQRVGVLSDFVFFGQDGSAVPGRYDDQFVELDGQWLIARRAVLIGG